MWLWDGIKTAIRGDWKGLGTWLWEGIKGGAAWVGRFISKAFDLVGGPEVMDLLFNFFKMNTRTLNGTESVEAQHVFGGAVDLWRVRVDEASIIAKIGAYFQGSAGMGVTLFHTINFNRKINAKPGNGDMHWLIHELSHVAQMQKTGSQYIGEAVAAQAGAGYSYTLADLKTKKLKDFNREQQGDVIADAYTVVFCGDNTKIGTKADYQPMLDQLRSGGL